MILDFRILVTSRENQELSKTVLNGVNFNFSKYDSIANFASLRTKCLSLHKR